MVLSALSSLHVLCDFEDEQAQRSPPRIKILSARSNFLSLFINSPPLMLDNLT
ncbi:hypothetical protein FD00_GL000535 [Liquorilactobacillus mali KCTC 3596 = DSM 20444]|uniref:Uncharacterized protein n=1 Tax=Liquorilactobacillus mali KCTC 3596 = DSM 20444 TaxID=1046596 RepID=A0A0R2EB46_9LACO|nr:hypothetical protein FD00_GL000535 [Liquorilactobacillus mali KCTC 3596 = DSM 20444]